ncbi:type 4a pilus biogenesis protein PilO [Derxia gummosa]|uniref:Type 4a pilus biogenesis protein PilO n=1 Tax=Derxia gummosa DSM 723 TaxID=1121388 RepID=A0A8B6X0V5_9BURK|nr:type 4a pilus biogenesis protein PilO [Derxia gummosa]
MKSPQIDLKRISDQFVGLNVRDVGTWPVAPRLAALFLILVAMLLGGYFLYWSDLLNDLEQGRNEEERLKQDYRGKLQQAINLDALKKQKEQVSQYVTALEKQLPSKAEMDALLSDINQAGLGRGLQFELFKPGASVRQAYYAELPINVRVTGRYHDMGAFVSDIANLPRIVTLGNIEVKTDPTGKLIFDAVARTFRYLDADEIEAARRDAAAAKKKDKGGAK